MTLVPNETEQALNRQYDVYAAAREEYRRKIAEQAAEIERLRAALRPFADALKGNWSMQPGSMKIIAGPWASDLRLELTLAHFRNASYALEDAAPSAPSDGEAATAALAEYEAHGGVSLKDLKAEIARAALEVK